MDFLNKAAAQLRDLFMSMTPAARITTGLLLAVVVISLTFLFRYQVSGPDAYLMGGEPFSSSQLPAMEAAFAKADLSDYEIEANRIKIPRGAHSAYMGALADAGALPPNFGDYLQKALDTDIWVSEKDKQERIKAAKQRELSLIIRSMHGVENASVMYDVKKQKSLGLARTDLVTASVSVQPRGDVDLDARQVSMIRKLVAGAIAGLKPENVTVADLTGRTYAGIFGTDGGIAGVDDPYYARKEDYERRLENDILTALSMVSGVIVKVSAELDPHLHTTEKSRQYDPKTVQISVDSRTESSKNEAAPNGGRPGLPAQQGGPSAGPATISGNTQKNTSQEEVLEESSRSVAGETIVERETTGLTPQNVMVSVAVPTDYYVQVWRAQNNGAEGDPPANEIERIRNETKATIQDAVHPFLPPVAKGEESYPRIVVSTFQSLPPTVIEGPSIGAQAVSWLGSSWHTLGLIGLSAFSLMLLRSVIKNIPETPSQPANLPTPAMPAISDDDDENEDRPKRKFAKSPSLKDDLTDLVREDPDAAASILRTWIGTPS